MNFSLRELSAQVAARFSVGRNRAGERNSFGYRCERVAEKHLKRKGMLVVARNFEDRFGEIDLIMVDGRTVVFTEVKARKSDDGGAGYEAVDRDKQAKLAKTALGYLRRHDLLENAYRFDVVSILWPPEESKPQIEHYADAFRPAGLNQMFG